MVMALLTSSDVHIRKALPTARLGYLQRCFDGEAVQQPVLARAGMPAMKPMPRAYTLDLRKPQKNSSWLM